MPTGFSYDEFNDLDARSWFDPELIIEAWFDPDMIPDVVTASADDVMPYVGGGYYPT